MFTTKKTVVTTTRGSGSNKLWKSFDDLMDRSSELIDAGSKLLDEAFRGEEASEAVSTTIRIRLSAQNISDLYLKKPLKFKTEGITILLEVGKA